jgi:hypothetical protein
LLVAAIVTQVPPVVAQPAKKVLAFSDSDIWRTASTPVISPDGAYVAYSAWPGEGDGESIVRSLASGKEFRFPRGGGAATISPKFTANNKLVLLPLTPTRAELDKAKADKAKGEDVPQGTLAVVDVATGQVVDKFPQSGPLFTGGDGAGFVIYRRPQAPATPKDEDGESPGGPMGGGGGKGA